MNAARPPRPPAADSVGEQTHSADSAPSVHDMSDGDRCLLLGVARGVTSNRADAEDAVHTAVLHALESATSSSQLLNWRAWLTTVVRRTAIDEIRRGHRWASVDLTTLNCVAQGAEPAHAWRETTSAQLRVALKACDPVLQVTFALWYWHRLSYKQIARRLSIPESTVATRLHRARLRVREVLAVCRSKAGFARRL
jgi:RNA polymerase sigma-70 factor (ECF subfamily)